MIVSCGEVSLQNFGMLVCSMCFFVVVLNVGTLLSPLTNVAVMIECLVWWLVCFCIGGVGRNFVRPFLLCGCMCGCSGMYFWFCMMCGFNE